MPFLNDDYEIMPAQMTPSRWHEFEFKGWKVSADSYSSEMFTEVMLISSSAVNKFIEIYKDRFAFTQPEFGFRPKDEIFFVRFGVIELSRLQIETD